MLKNKNDIQLHTGDDGITTLWGGSRIRKDSIKVEAIGAIDELSAAISVVKTTSIDARTLNVLEKLLPYCYQINLELAADAKGKKLLTWKLDDSGVTWLESLIEEFKISLPKLNHFIIPGNKPAEAFLNLSRTVCRRAERRLWTLVQQEEVNPNILKFINRLSELLFTLMRFEAQRE